MNGDYLYEWGASCLPLCFVAYLQTLYGSWDVSLYFMIVCMFIGGSIQIAYSLLCPTTTQKYLTCFKRDTEKTTAAAHVSWCAESVGGGQCSELYFLGIYQAPIVANKHMMYKCSAVCFPAFFLVELFSPSLSYHGYFKKFYQWSKTPVSCVNYVSGDWIVDK